MKLMIPLLFLIIVVLFACSQKAQNPFYGNYDTPFQTPPFDLIKTEHYLPAFKEGMKQQLLEVEKIANSSESPTFKNTLEALEYTGVLLTKVSNVFFNQTSANTNDELQSISKEVSPLLSKHTDDILLNEKLFARIKAVHAQKDALQLTVEQQTLLDKTYRDFVRGGANLNDAEKSELRKINEELSVLSLQFGENVLKENNAFEMVIEDKADLAGLPENVINTAAEAAKEHNQEGKWVFTLHKPSMIPFLQYSQKRDLREKIFNAYINRGNNNNELDNKEILSKMVKLRVRRANLLGYKTHADYVLEENMAKTPANVYQLLNQVWQPAGRRLLPGESIVWNLI